MDGPRAETRGALHSRYRATTLLRAPHHDRRDAATHHGRSTAALFHVRSLPNHRRHTVERAITHSFEHGQNFAVRAIALRKLDQLVASGRKLGAFERAFDFLHARFVGM